MGSTCARTIADVRHWTGMQQRPEPPTITPPGMRWIHRVHNTPPRKTPHANMIDWLINWLLEVQQTITLISGLTPIIMSQRRDRTRPFVHNSRRGLPATQPSCCHECGRPGHVRGACPLVRCFQCGLLGHISTNCWKTGGGNQVRFSLFVWKVYWRLSDI